MHSWPQQSPPSLCGVSGSALAQVQEQPKPPQPDTTTVVEPKLPAPEAPEQPAKQGPAHVPPDASGIDLSEIRTNDLELLYFDPAQTYLTPYIGRAFTNSLRFHEKKFHWKPWEPDDGPAQGLLRLRQCRRALVRPTMRSCSTSRR